MGFLVFIPINAIEDQLILEIMAKQTAKTAKRAYFIVLSSLITLF